MKKILILLCLASVSHAEDSWPPCWQDPNYHPAPPNYTSYNPFGPFAKKRITVSNIERPKPKVITSALKVSKPILKAEIAATTKDKPKL